MNQEFDDIVGLAAVGQYAKLQSEGRTANGNLFSSIPPEDPAYVSGNIGGVVILHYVWIPILCIAFVPVFFGSLFAALLAWKLIAILVMHLDVSFYAARLITGIPLGLLWLVGYWRFFRRTAKNLCKLF
jgi:hypothetical protein